MHVERGPGGCSSASQPVFKHKYNIVRLWSPQDEDYSVQLGMMIKSVLSKKKKLLCFDRPHTDTIPKLIEEKLGLISVSIKEPKTIDGKRWRTAREAGESDG